MWGEKAKLTVGVLKFIPKVLDGVEVRALCRPVKFFHARLGTPVL